MDYFNNVTDPAVSIESALAASSAGLPSGGIPPFGEIESTRWGIGVNTLMFLTAPNFSYQDSIQNNSVGQLLPPQTTYTGGTFTGPTITGGTTVNMTINNPTMSGGTGSGITFYNPTFYNPTLYNPITISGGSGFVNPMTTIGDMIYGGVAGTPLRLSAPPSISGGTGYFLAISGGGTPFWNRGISLAQLNGAAGGNIYLNSITGNIIGLSSVAYASVTFTFGTTGLPPGTSFTPLFVWLTPTAGSSTSNGMLYSVQNNTLGVNNSFKADIRMDNGSNSNIYVLALGTVQ